VEPLAKKSRLALQLIREIKRVIPSELRDDYVAWFNTLTLPRAYLYVDPDGLCHLVNIRCKTQRAEGLKPGNLTMLAGSSSPGGMGIQHSADVIWDFDPVTGIWMTTKDRTGDFERLCPIKCGGIPSRRNSVSQP
jgi:hypothetical protein